MANGSLITVLRLRELLDYDPQTGEFSWKTTYGGRYRAKVGFLKVSKQGYRRIVIGVDYRHYNASCLAWLWVTGEWPTSLVDHINRNSIDNRWQNLRLLTGSQNKLNGSIYRNNTSGVTGVCWHKKSRRWIVRVSDKHLGQYITKSEAHRAAKIYRKVAKSGLFPKRKNRLSAF